MEIYEADTIEKYNRFFGFETRHPLISIVRFDNSVGRQAHRMRFGFYALFVKQTRGCRIDYGRTTYDFDCGTVVSFGPGQTVSVQYDNDDKPPEGTGLLFHPDLLLHTSLGQKIRQYSFFSYASNEALHMSDQENATLIDYMEKIDRELQNPADRFTKQLIVSNIDIMLNYCMRFYERQFASRQELGNNTLAQFEHMLDDYIYNGHGATDGVPTVRYFADKICLSPNYFGDLIKQATGKTARDYINFKMIDFAKNSLLNPELTTKQIAGMLGFSHPQHFNRFFKKLAGYTPNAYRRHS